MVTAAKESFKAPLPRLGTLGMFILDKFHYLQADGTPETPSDRGHGTQIGGGGTYVAVAASMWLAPDRVCMLVDRGTDWSPDWQRQLDQYVDTCALGAGEVGIWAYRSRADRTTLALNVFRGETRDFEYLTPKVRIEPHDLLMRDAKTDTYSLPEVIHLVCSPERAAGIAKTSTAYSADGRGARRNGDGSDQTPFLVWEPMPSDATPANLDACLSLFDQVHLFSPNHEEAACLLSVMLPDEEDDAAIVACVEAMVSKLLLLAAKKSTLARTPVIGLRSGRLGTYVEPAHVFSCNHSAPATAGFWVPAYHDRSMAHRVVDVTGGGNGWLGGFAAGMADAVANLTKLDAMTSREALLHAGVRGSVSASYMIEQLSLPPATNFRPGATAVGSKHGVDEGVQARFDRLYKRITKS